MNLWSRLQGGLARTREQLGKRLGSLLGLRGAVDAATRAQLEEALLSADTGPATAERLIELSERRMKGLIQNSGDVAGIAFFTTLQKVEADPYGDVWTDANGKKAGVEKPAEKG